MNFDPQTQKSKKIILIKVSGGCLQDSDQNMAFSHEKLIDLVAQLKTLKDQYKIGLVVGGGNFWRGKSNYLTDLSDQTAHYVGMLATNMNGLVLMDYLQNNGVKAQIFSPIACDRLVQELNPFAVKQALVQNDVLIFVSGTGMPFVSTDTAAAIRAIELSSDLILMGKDGAKGVFSSDPNLDPDAIFYDHLSYNDVISQNLEVMDLTALFMCAEHKIKILVFDQSIKGAFVKALAGEIEFSLIQ